jgi:hypothetical protein
LRVSAWLPPGPRTKSAKIRSYATDFMKQT